MAYTTADVKAMFESAGLTDASTPYETEAQRLQRIADQLNQGTRDAAEVQSAIQATTREGFQYSAEALLMHGGSGSAELQTTSGNNGQIWLDSSTGRYYMVFYYPGTDAPLMYSATEAEIKATLNNQAFTVDRTLAAGDFAALGGINAGHISDVDVASPFRHLQEQLAKEIQLAPWLGDPDFLALTVEAALEGREISETEIALTGWYRNHNESQRQWMILFNRDPASAARMIEDNVALVRSQIEAAGGAAPPDDIVRLMATQFTTGNWSQTTLGNQIRAITDPASGIALLPELSSALSGRSLDTTQRYEDEVRNLALQWLGPVFGQWSESQIKSWAGRWRNDPDAETQLLQTLRQQRLAMFPEYDNPLLSYEDIAGPWRGLFQQQWGQLPEETDSLFTQVIRMNDVAEASKLLRSEGLTRGVETVKSDLLNTVGRITAADQVRTVNG